MTTVAAVDLGATSGRVVVGHVGPRSVRLEEVARFPNGPVEMTATGARALHWDVDRLLGSIRDGLRSAARFDPISVGVDSWGVDYGLLCGARLLHPPFHYRDGRTADLPTVTDRSTWHTQFRASGVYPHAINTVNQVQDDARHDRLARADALLFVPDLVRWWLSETITTEMTIASTSGLLGLDGRWSAQMLDMAGLDARLLPTVVQPGTDVGPLTTARREELRLAASTRVIAVAGHDTASAVAATPRLDESGAYISCGTWGLVGVELAQPVVSAHALAAGFTNERGIDGTVRFQRNVTGLWILNRCLEAWGLSPGSQEALALIRSAGDEPRARELVDVDDPRFATAGDMPTLLRSWFVERGSTPPDGPVPTARMIVDSIAQAFADTIRQAAALSSRFINRVNLTGGGSLNAQLAQEVAERTGLPVTAGPVEATALGNVLVQARAMGLIAAEVGTLRRMVDRSSMLTVYQP